MFSLARALFSPDSAGDCSSLFVWFIDVRGFRVGRDAKGQDYTQTRTIRTACGEAMSNELAVQIEEIQNRLDHLEARRIAGPRGPAGDIQAAVDNAERVAKAIVIERFDSYVQRTEAIAA